MIGRRITVALDDDVRMELEAQIGKSGKSFQETVNETLRLGLLAQRKAKPFKIRAKNLGLKPGFSLEKPWDLIEEIEGPGYK
jgi:hypothetical protein